MSTPIPLRKRYTWPNGPTDAELDALGHIVRYDVIQAIGPLGVILTYAWDVTYYTADQMEARWRDEYEAALTDTTRGEWQP